MYIILLKKNTAYSIGGTTNIGDAGLIKTLATNQLFYVMDNGMCFYRK